ncbi:MAG TPA: hypothetical protein VGD57_00545 [Candidatus Dormibacteraeota bacterium]|jgi:hypothetical protein
MKRLTFVVVICCLLAACATKTPASTGSSGAQGVVTVGPTCPVERVNSPCAPRPLAATVIISDGSGRIVTRIHSGSDGHFRVDLAPGTYSFTGDRANGAALPRPIPATVNVVAGSYTTVTVQYDSGIR